MSLDDVQVKLTQHEARIKALEDIIYKREGAKVPEFDPKILMEHEWKGKNIGVRQWAPGSLAWGWDFTEQFPEEVIKVLQKGPLTIEGYVFTFNGKIVNVKKEK